LRWWDGSAWAPATTDDPDTPPPTGAAATVVAGRSAPPSLGFSAVGWAFGAVVLSIIAAIALSTAAYYLFPDTDIAWVLGAQVGQWGVLIGACRRYSRQRGTGDVATDFGFRFERRDVWRGVGYFWIGFVAVVVVESFLTDPRFQGTNTELPRHFRGDIIGFAVIAVLTVVGAPLVEELFFRGLLLRGLLAKFSERRAVIMQAVVFGIAHVNPVQGLANVSVVAFATTIGCTVGFAAVRYRRLGPGIVAHGIQNLLATTVVLLTR
jgi:membrane protease YdiL (CAAX protease family)